MIEPVVLRGATSLPPPSALVNPKTVTHFQALLGEPQIPLASAVASAVASAWQEAETLNRRLRVRLTDRLQSGVHRLWSFQDLAALQYDVASITFQQEVVTQLAKKATDGVTTLIKNG